MGNAHEIVLAAGCFWGMQAFIDHFQGVLETVVGYANSLVPDPSYKQVCSGTTNAAEAVFVKYDPDHLPLRVIVDMFFVVVDPYTKNRQGNDVGSQYRTGIYYTHDEDKDPLASLVAAKQKLSKKPFAIEVMKLGSFFPAEDYHQQYLVHNPSGYCHINMGLTNNFKEYKKQ